MEIERRREDGRLLSSISIVLESVEEVPKAHRIAYRFNSGNCRDKCVKKF